MALCPAPMPGSLSLGGLMKEQETDRCQQPHGCERAPHNNGDNRLTEEEREAPACCRICGVVMCDMCAAWLDNIPSEKIPHNTPGNVTSGVLCSEHFNEDWV
jgi:hypothetical protein